MTNMEENRKVLLIIALIWLGVTVRRQFRVHGYVFPAGHVMSTLDCRILAANLGDAEGNIIWPSLGD